MKTATKPNSGIKGGLRKIAEDLSAWRKRPLSKGFYDIIDKWNKGQLEKEKPKKKIGKPKSDLEA